MKPRVGVTAWKRAFDAPLGAEPVFYALAEEYVGSVAAAGGVAVLLPHLDPADAPAALGGLDALVLSGGPDVDPASYGEANEGQSHDTDPVADRSEIALARAAAEHEVPTLAICRGMQVLNVAFGGTLHQHIWAPDGPHLPFPPEPGAVLALRHEVALAPGSRLARLYGATTRRVNTIHHQAVKDLAAGFRATATAPDGTIEAMEAEGDRWEALGVQWHPEKMAGADAALFAHLVGRAQRRRAG